MDNLQSGHREAIEAVIHFAVNSLVGGSMEEPYEYYHNNAYGMMCLLNVMRQNNVHKIIFSSIAATSGEPKSIPILENNETIPTDTYGEIKLAMGKMMRWFDQAY